MNRDFHHPLDMRDIARRAMLEEGFAPDVPDDALREVRALSSEQMTVAGDPATRDLRSLLWSSIDNIESRDLDQVEFTEREANGGIRVMIGIADVDAFVPEGSATDRYAAKNTTSVYTGIETYSMLPEALSMDITSLLEGVDRRVIIIDFSVSSEGAVNSNGIHQALIRNHAKLDYESVGRWLEGSAPVPERVSILPGLEDQLRLQDEVTGRLRELSRRRGALEIETIEASPVAVDGKVYGLTIREKNRARHIIENLMVTANTQMASFLRAAGSPSIQRVVSVPQRWPRIVEIAESLGQALPSEPDSRALNDFLARRKVKDPEHFPDLSLSIVKLLGAGEYVVLPAGADTKGHFGLAVHDYTHSTAPNRRYIDLVIQRLLKAVVAGEAAPYTEAEMTEIAGHCNQRQSASRKVERLMRKVIAAVMLGERVGDVFDSIVTGVSQKGTFVRLISPPAEGRVVWGEGGLDVGDKVKVRLVSTNPEKGFIDFERAV
jgi:VacB/RNase II family 3'-5' exoribonuclease